MTKIAGCADGLLVCCEWFGCGWAGCECSAKIDKLYVFGDSYSDQGEGYLDANGPTAVVYFAQKLGIRIAPSNGEDPKYKSLNFAVSGAQTGSGLGNKTQDALIGYGMKNQVQDFVDQAKSSRTSRFQSEDNPVLHCRQVKRQPAGGWCNGGE